MHRSNQASKICCLYEDIVLSSTLYTLSLTMLSFRFLADRKGKDREIREVSDTTNYRNLYTKGIVLGHEQPKNTEQGRMY